MYLDVIVLLAPHSLVAVRLTVNFPVEVKVYAGFCWVLSVTPSLLKSQAHAVGALADWSVNRTSSGTVPETGVALNAGTGRGPWGGALTLM